MRFGVRTAAKTGTPGFGHVAAVDRYVKPVEDLSGITRGDIAIEKRQRGGVCGAAVAAAMTVSQRQECRGSVIAEEVEGEY